MATEALRIHSVGEAYLLVMVTPCEACGKGPLEAKRNEALGLDGTAGRKLITRCGNCGHEQEFIFSLEGVPEGAGLTASGLPVINPTDEPSRVIDLAQWLVLFEGIIRTAHRQTDPGESRRLGYEAAQCLDEALKFYAPGPAEWPDESAFYHDWTLRRYREHRHLFARTRLIDLRRRLPTLAEMEERIQNASRKRPKRPWWAFWRR